MKYNYKAKTAEGRATKGSVEAKSLNEALSSLRESGLFIVDINSGDLKNLNMPGSALLKKVGLKDKIIFTKELGMMIKSGLPIVEALEALAEETHNQYFSDTIASMISDIKGGQSLSNALDKHRDIFSEIYINMVRSGEESGKIDSVLARLATQLEKDFDLTRKIKGALAYPIFVMLALIAVMVLVMTVIIPQLKTIFDDAGVSLPFITKCVLGLSNILIKDGIFIGIGALLLVGGIIAYSKTKKGQRNIDKMLIKIPVLGKVLQKTYLSRFTRTFAALAASGLPVIDVFKVSANTIGNSVYSDEILTIADKIKSGQQISSALKESPLMPKMIGQLATVGEKSGNIEEVFDQIADFFDRDLDVMTANLSTMLEPVIMVVMGVGIGLIIVSVLQPIYGLVNAI